MVSVNGETVPRPPAGLRSDQVWSTIGLTLLVEKVLVERRPTPSMLDCVCVCVRVCVCVCV